MAKSLWQSGLEISIIILRYLSKERSATMSILDIGLLTGFSVDETDLKQVSGLPTIVVAVVFYIARVGTT